MPYLIVMGFVLNFIACGPSLSEKQKSIAEAINKQDWKLIFEGSYKKIHPKDEYDEEEIILFSKILSARIKNNAAEIAQKLDHLDKDIFINALKLAHTIATKSRGIDEKIKAVNILKEEKAKYGGFAQIEKFKSELSKFTKVALETIDITDMQDRVRAFVMLNAVIPISSGDLFQLGLDEIKTQ